MAGQLKAGSVFSTKARPLARRVWLLAGSMALAVLLASGLALAAAGDTTRASVSSVGAEGNKLSYRPSISSDGRFVTFTSSATNLVPNDTNGRKDVFVRNRRTGTTRRVSLSSSDTQANGHSYRSSISADGRFVAFSSSASNLVANDTNGKTDMFVRDRRAGTIERVNVGNAGNQANNYSEGPSISADGRFVAFSSSASNLVANDTNDRWDVFVRDRQAGTTELVSVDSQGDQANSDTADNLPPSISADGRFVAFGSLATNLVQGDANDAFDVFVRDRQAGTTELVSVDSQGDQANSDSYVPSISSDGRFVAFTSYATNLVQGDTGRRDVFVRDRRTGTTQRVSVDSEGDPANNYSYGPSISAGGRFVAFGSPASNLVPGDTNGKWDVFVRDRRTGTTQRVSVDSEGDQTKGYTRCVCSHSPISSDGRFVAFTSSATNLVTNDTNGASDIFVHEFTVDTRAPMVARVEPAGGTTGVSRGVSVKATFSEQVYFVKANFELYRKGSSTPVDAVVHSVAGTNNRKWVLNHDSPLRSGTTYIAKVQTGVVDKVGRNLDQDPTQAGDQPMLWNFKTHG